MNDCYNITQTDRCCFNCSRWSGGQNFYAKATRGWCMRKRTSKRADDVCGDFSDRHIEKGRFEKTFE
jgi:hypothetical protein